MSMDSPAAILFDINGKRSAVGDGYLLTSDNNSLIVAGSDGYNAHFIKTTTSGTILVNQQVSSAARTSINASLTSVVLVNTNLNRKGLKLFNDSQSGVLLIGYGSAVTDTDFSLKIPIGGLFELSVPVYTGAIFGLWTAADGAVRITEMT